MAVLPPSDIFQSSIAPIVGVGVVNTQFVATSTILPRKIAIIGTYDPTITTIADNVPALITSPEQAAADYGQGFMIHRLARAAYRTSGNLETWVIPQPEGAGAKSTCTITVTGTASAAGTIYLYIAGDLVRISVPNGTLQNDIASLIDTEITRDDDLPVTSNVVTNVITLTAKSEGPWGDDIIATTNLGFQEEDAPGVALAITAMSGGSGVPDIDDALQGMGTGDEQNSRFWTDVIHGYGQDSSTLNKLSVYNGEGDTYDGNYSRPLARPFRSLVGDNVADTAGLNALVSLAAGRKQDRTNGVVAVPDSPSHPSEIAATAIGRIANTNNNRAEESYVGQILTGIWPGTTPAERWTASYSNRNGAVVSGISPTLVQDNTTVVLQSVRSFYRPDGTPITSNIYASMRNISITQNVLYNIKLNFSQTRWQGISIVSDVSRVANSTSRQKARDISAVLDDCLALANSFEENAWIFTAAFTVSRFQADDTLIQIRPGGTGFNIIFPVIYSGEGGIIDTIVQADTSLDILL